MRTASASTWGFMTLYFSMSSARVAPSTRFTLVSNKPPLASSPSRLSVPPALLYSWMEYLCELGESLHRKGVRRLSASISFMVKSTLPSWATASR